MVSPKREQGFNEATRSASYTQKQGLSESRKGPVSDEDFLHPQSHEASSKSMIKEPESSLRGGAPENDSKYTNACMAAP